MNDTDMQLRLVRALQHPQWYPHAAKNIRVIETHISWVVLAGEFAYKIKKAVDLGFLDYTKLAARKQYCAEEIRLNRRTAPELYLDVVALGGAPDAPVFGSEPAFEYAVRMRRFAQDELFDRLLARDELSPCHIDRLATVIARFHAGLTAAAHDSLYGTPATIQTFMRQNFAQMRPLLKDAADAASLAALARASEAEFAACAALFAARRMQGFVRECHGDLHLGNIARIDDAPVPFDGIEFNPALRWIDVMDELAFVMMDLLHHGRTDYAWRWLNACLEASGDYAGVAVLRFYLAYRAAVRAKVGAIRAAQTDVGRHTRLMEMASCREHLALVQRCLNHRHPALIITHGLPGSGKTTFAQYLIEQMGAIRIRSDVERKRLHGLAALESSRDTVGRSRLVRERLQSTSSRNRLTASVTCRRCSRDTELFVGRALARHVGLKPDPQSYDHVQFGDMYGAAATEKTYARLHELAREIVQAGYVVIVDAAFLQRAEREQFRQLARELSVPFAIASLHAPETALRQRLNQRQHDASEADVAVLEKLRAVQQPLAPEEHAWTARFTTAQAPDSETNARAWRKLDLILGKSRVE
ncbi:MAG: AAA family ATPase [Gallionella sp.]|nr:AAA family ATPase [Gallionella sp.]